MRRWVEAERIDQANDGSGRLAVDGASLARFAQERAEAAAHPPDASPGGQSLRNRFPGLVTRVVKDTVMAQVEIQAGGHRVVSLLSPGGADQRAPEAAGLA